MTRAAVHAPQPGSLVSGHPVICGKADKWKHPAPVRERCGNCLRRKLTWPIEAVPIRKAKPTRTERMTTATFEDEFMDLQGDLVPLMLEELEGLPPVGHISVRVDQGRLILIQRDIPTEWRGRSVLWNDSRREHHQPDAYAGTG